MSAAAAAREIEMAARKKRKKTARKATTATRKPQKATKPPKASKAKARPSKPQDATGSPQSGFQNPFRVNGVFWAATEALKALGIGKQHPFAEIIPAVKKAMSENWKVFAEKAARNEETGKDAEHRILQNISTLSRQDYGRPLRDLGYEVRWSGREKHAGLFKIGGE